MIGVIIASFLLIVSTIGLLYIMGKKLPVLLTYPAKEEGSSPKEDMKRLFAIMRDSKAMRQVSSPDVLVQNVLSKTRIVALKTESKTGRILENLRKKSQEKNSDSKFSDDYWKKLKQKKV
ncbi:MAG: hypothetical protein O3C23_00120 [bacterium]|nr:hypothetical protein [bacterium]